ncbi:MAG: corrinoid protein [Candidatus Hadarchaeales archaeon]
MAGELEKAIVELRLDEIRGLCERRLKEGADPVELVAEMRRGMEEVGRRFERGEYFLPELMVAGETMKAGLEVLKPQLEKAGARERATVVVGTVQGDIHDIGKNIFTMLARTAGFRVVDLGVDVPPERFVEAVRRERAQVVGMSCLITTSFPSMQRTVELLEKEGLRPGVKVLLGGAPLTEELGRKMGADAAVNDAVRGVEFLRKWFQP